MAKTTIKIRTFEDACKHLKLNPEQLPSVTVIPVKHQAALTAYYKLFIIAEALNDGWQPDWNNTSEYKYLPWFSVDASDDNPSGSGLSSYVCDFTRSLTSVGARLCYKTSELAKYAGTQFKDLYEAAFLLPQ